MTVIILTLMCYIISIISKYPGGQGTSCQHEGIFTGKFGHVTSPKYPQNYPDFHGEKCIYVIEVTYDAQINLTFTNFDLQKVGDDGICRDFVKVSVCNK